MAARAAAIDPAAAGVLAALPPEDPDAVIDLHAVRAGYDMLGALGGGDDIPPGALEITDASIASVAVRLYQPVGGAPDPTPALVFFHGGGFTIGSLASHDPQCRQLAHLAQVAVVSVDYRLAPEHQFPAAFDDARTVVAWLLDHANEIGLDPERLGVGGNSAGGGISAGLAQEFGTRLRFQALLYPSTDFSGEWPSYEENRTGYLLTMKTMRWFRDQFAPDEASWIDVRLSPIRGDVTATPPAWVLTCGYDPLRDEGAAYADALAAAGVAVTHVHVDDQIHECVQLAGVIPAGRSLLVDLATALRSGLRK